MNSSCSSTSLSYTAGPGMKHCEQVYGDEVICTFFPDFISAEDHDLFKVVLKARGSDNERPERRYKIFPLVLDDLNKELKLKRMGSIYRRFLEILDDDLFSIISRYPIVPIPNTATMFVPYFFEPWGQIDIVDVNKTSGDFGISTDKGGYKTNLPPDSLYVAFEDIVDTSTYDLFQKLSENRVPPIAVISIFGALNCAPALAIFHSEMQKEEREAINVNLKQTFNSWVGKIPSIEISKEKYECFVTSGNERGLFTDTPAYIRIIPMVGIGYKRVIN